MAPVRLLAVFCICLFIQSSVRAIFVSRLELTKDGHISKDSQLPKCDDGRMKLLSYSYKFVCGDNKCPNAPDEQLSVLAEAVIHSMCSLKRKCVHQESSLITIPGNMKAFLNISYTCVGRFDTFVNICRNKTISSGDTIHLTSDDHAKRFETCKCTVRGRFHLTLADVRLRSAAHPNDCSPAQLLVNFKTYQCDQMTNTNGSVFNKTAAGVLTDEVISYTTNSETEEPEMIYLTAKPEGRGHTEISCIHYPRIVSPTTMETTQTDEVATGLYNDNEEKEQSASAASRSVAMVAVGVGVTLAIVLVVVYLRRRRRKQREKKCRLERLEMLVERQLMQSLRVQQQGNNHYGEYSFARDDTAAYKCGVGDYVDLVEAPKAAQHGRGAGRLDESNLKVNNTDIESNLVSSSKPKSTSGRLKKCLSRSPKQETSIYSYATHEPLLRNTKETAKDETANEITNQSDSSIASNGQKGRYYFKLEPKQTAESGATSSIHHDGTDKSGDISCNTKMSSEKKKKGEHFIDTRKDNVSASRCNNTEVYDMAHYAVPKVDGAKHDNFKEHKTTPSVSRRNAPRYNMTHDKNVYANETSKNHSGADMYETIEMNRAVVPQSKNSNEVKSQGIIDKILNKITKNSKQKPSYETTEAETEDGKAKQRSKTKGQYSTTKEDSTKETINSSQKTEGSQSATFQGKQESTAADEDHYDKLTIDDNVVPKHPNYDKVHVSVPKRSLTLKMFKK